MERIKLTKDQISMLMIGNCRFYSDDKYECYIPFVFKSTDEEDVFDLVHVNEMSEEDKNNIIF